MDSLSVLKEPTFPLPFPPNYFLQVLLKYRAPETSGAYRRFHFLRRKRLGRRLFGIIEDVYALLNAYDSCIHDSSAAIDFGQLIATWRVLQHQVLSIPSGGDLLFELCRVAVTAYLTECLEPLPVVGLFHRTSSRRLMLLIDECDKLGYLTTFSGLLLWSTILGGWVSRSSPLHLWYVEQLRDSPIAVTEESWDEIRDLTEQYLPFRNRQLEGCLRFWSEACKWLEATGSTDTS